MTLGCTLITSSTCCTFILSKCISNSNWSVVKVPLACLLSMDGGTGWRQHALSLVSCTVIKSLCSGLNASQSNLTPPSPSLSSPAAVRVVPRPARWWSSLRRPFDRSPSPWHRRHTVPAQPGPACPSSQTTLGVVACVVPNWAPAYNRWCPAIWRCRQPDPPDIKFVAPAEDEKCSHSTLMGWLGKRKQLERSIIRPGDGFIELQSNCVSGVGGRGPPKATHLGRGDVGEGAWPSPVISLPITRTHHAFSDCPTTSTMLGGLEGSVYESRTLCLRLAVSIQKWDCY